MIERLKMENMKDERRQKFIVFSKAFKSNEMIFNLKICDFFVSYEDGR